MSRQRLLVYLLKAGRSFYGGFISAMTIYFFYRVVSYEDPIRIPLSLAAILAGAIIKSAIINRCRRAWGHFNTLLISYLLQAIPLIISNDINLGHRGTAFTFTKYFCLGFFPFDGEEVGVFEEVEKRLLKLISRNKGESVAEWDNIKGTTYIRVGYFGQALGSLFLGVYLFLGMSTDYDQKLAVHRALIAFSFFTAASFLASFLLCTGQNGKLNFAGAEAEQINAERIILPWKELLRPRMHSFAEGVASGCLSAPFLAYYFQVKLDFYYHEVGLLLASFFLLKGIGAEVLRRLLKQLPASALTATLNRFNALSNALLAAVALIPLLPPFLPFLPSVSSSSLAVGCILAAFPFWHFGRIRLSSAASASVESVAVLEAALSDLWVWERAGSVLGIVLGGFSFSILFFRPHFGYAFALAAIIRQINAYFMDSGTIFSNLDASSTAIKQDEQQFEIHLDSNVVSQQKEDNSSNSFKQQALPNRSLDSYSPRVKKIISIIILLVMVSLFTFFYFNSLKGNRYDIEFWMGTKGQKIARPRQLRLFNSSMAEYLVKQNITKVQLMNCDAECLQNYRTKDTHYSRLDFTSDSPQWLHFPHAPYFSNPPQVEAYFAAASAAPLTVSGFSVFWEHPLRYQKMKDAVRQALHDFAEKNGFHFAEMPSLNLRGVENSIVSIFTREKRIPTQLPSFVKTPPPKNYLAFQSTLKLSFNLPELREFILYHLSMGFDKFFLYDNDQTLNSPTLFQGSRITSYFKRCLRYNLSHHYEIFQQIWQQFYDHIIYFPWVTRRFATVEDHSQFQSYEHYYLHFKEVIRYTSFTDMDQYIFSPSFHRLSDYLQKMEQQHDVGTVYLIARSFQFYICAPEKLVIEQTNWTPIQYERLTVKTITMNNLFVRPAVHTRQSKNGNFAFVGSPWHDLILRHYLLTTDHLESIKLPVLKFDTDDSLLPLAQGLKQACHGKCTDSFKSSCPKQKQDAVLKEFCQTWPRPS